MDRSRVNTLFKRFQAHNAHPKTELNFHTPFELLVAVLLSAQATDLGVNRATAVLFPIANTPQQFVDLGQARLEHYVKSINYYRTKAKHLIAASRRLLENHHGHVPRDREALESLPGVGRKTANVILNTAFGEPTIAVDTHILRVSNRIGLTKAKTPLTVEQALLKVIPKKFHHDAHHWLILHGRYVCKARKPLCHRCLIADLCEYPDKNL